MKSLDLLLLGAMFGFCVAVSTVARQPAALPDAAGDWRDQWREMIREDERLREAVRREAQGPQFAPL